MAKNIIRIFVFLLSAVSFVLNAGPVITNRQINIGIITGVAAAFIFLIYGIFFKEINNLIKKIHRHSAGRIALYIIGTGIITGLVFGGTVFAKICRHSAKADKATDYIIVLGCQVKGNEPGIYLKSRINKAYEYLTENTGSKAILSGGQGSDEAISEGQCMFNCLTEMGIDESRLIIEDKSNSTVENFRNSLSNLKDNGIEINEITVVTNDFHEYRASKFAEKCGLTAYSYPSKTPWTGYVPFAVREVYAVIYQVYLGGSNLSDHAGTTIKE